MKIRLSGIVALLLFLPLHLCAQGVDSLGLSALNSKLEEYLSAIKKESLSVQQEECDFLIESCSDSLVRQSVAVYLYDHYRKSEVMGFEAVAIHIFDRWFSTGKVVFGDEMKQFEARLFADFNRQSLLGMRAPSLELETDGGEWVQVVPESGIQPGFKVLYFYDTQCVKCSAETILLTNVLAVEDFPLTVYAVYVGGDRQQWDEYRQKRFSFESAEASVVHCWDGSESSDFKMKYGLLKTPGMFLLAPDYTILGRFLDTYSLTLMLKGLYSHPELEYGSQEAMQAMRQVFGGASKSELINAADRIAERTLPKGDTLSFRQMMGDMLYFCASEHKEHTVEATEYLIDRYVDGCPRAWATADDSLKVVGYSAIVSDLLSREIPGKKVARVKVPAVLQTKKGTRSGVFRLDRLRAKTNYIFFQSPQCSNCRMEKEALSASWDSLGRPDVLYIDFDAISQSNPDLMARLLDSFDLTSLPHILVTDRRGTILRRYVSFLP